MSDTDKPILFNFYDPTGSSLTSNVHAVYSDVPPMMLCPGADDLPEPLTFRRHAAQHRAICKAIGESLFPGLLVHGLFGSPLEWKYREYILPQLLPPHLIDRKRPSVLQAADLPPQPIDAAKLLEHIGKIKDKIESVCPPPSSDDDPPVAALPSTSAEKDAALYLFNIIVALEWIPNDIYLRRLKWGFRRASEFLYDVSNGGMAIGQVVLGGPEFMPCADIQILASNRLSPRSWVSAMHEEAKYMPIRVGRGVWNKNRAVTIPWDEPEAYRILVHEWGHYALDLRDEYLETVWLEARENQAARSTSGYGLVQADDKVVIPTISLATESIMASLEGTSELAPRRGRKMYDRLRSAWEVIQLRGRFPRLNPLQDREPYEGPGYLPLPLPYFYEEPLTAARQKLDMPAQAPRRRPTLRPPISDLVLEVPGDISSEHCWVYVLKTASDIGANSDVFADCTQVQVIAQGTVEPSSADDGFPLLGTTVGDWVVLIGRDDKYNPVVLYGKIREASPVDDKAIVKWYNGTPDVFPTIDVIPLETGFPDRRMAALTIVVDFEARADPEYEVCVFPLGYGEPKNDVSRVQLPTLDGHVVVTWMATDGSRKLVISTFSQGGGPKTVTPTGPPPISAGSSEGNVMLFFEETNDTRDFSDRKVVTTLLHGDPTWNGQCTAKGPDGTWWEEKVEARSYLFSLASNKPLPEKLSPSLVMYYDVKARANAGRLVLCRYDGENRRWQAAGSYAPPDRSFLALALDQHSAPGLLQLEHPTARVERFRLGWILDSSPEPPRPHKV